jgi:proteic killer suppression protein
MIESFRHKGLRQFYADDNASKLPAEMVERIRDILTALDNVKDSLAGLERPSFSASSAEGRPQGLWAVTVRANRRIIFRFENGHVRDVDPTDYH